MAVVAEAEAKVWRLVEELKAAKADREQTYQMGRVVSLLGLFKAEFTHIVELFCDSISILWLRTCRAARRQTAFGGRPSSIRRIPEFAQHRREPSELVGVPTTQRAFGPRFKLNAPRLATAASGPIWAVRHLLRTCLQLYA